MARARPQLTAAPVDIQKPAKAPKPNGALDHKGLVQRFKKSGMTYSQLAEASGVKRGNLSGWVEGRTTYDREIAKALDKRGC